MQSFPHIDRLDRRLLYELDLNSRISVAELSRKVKKPAETIHYRLRRFFEEEILNGFYTVTNTSAIGYYYYKLYFRFRKASPTVIRKALEHLKCQPHVAYLAQLRGYFDCICLIMARSPKDIAEVLFPFMKSYGAYVSERHSVTFLSTHRYNQRFFFRGTRVKDWHYPISLGSRRLDPLELRILQRLTRNARVSYTELASELDITLHMVKRRIEVLEREKIIIAYVTSPNFKKLGLRSYQINLALRDPMQIDKVLGFFKSERSCLFGIETLGKYDCVVEVHLPSELELDQLMEQFHAKFSSICFDYDVSTIVQEHVMVWSPFD